MIYVIDERQGGPQAEIDDLRAQLAAMTKERDEARAGALDWQRMYHKAYDEGERYLELEADARRWARAWKAAAKRRKPEREAFEAYGRWCFNEHRGEYGVGDIDGASAEEQAVKVGLLEEFTATEPCCDNCQCAFDPGFPTNCLRAAFPRRETR